MRSYQGVTKRCHLSWLANSALVYEPKCGGRGGIVGSQLYTGAQINFVDLMPYLTYDSYIRIRPRNNKLDERRTFMPSV
jgi:hypothetical protein